MRIDARSLPVLLSLLGGACAGAPTPQEIVLDRDDIEVRHDVVVRPGSYRVRDENGDGVLHVVADGVTVTLAGVTLDGAGDGVPPDRFEGIGVAIAGHAGVRVVGGALRGFRVGLRAERARDLVLDGLDVAGNRAMRLRSTPAREDASDWLWPHENDHDEWETRYGAGLALVDCDGAAVQRCRARTTQNGLLLVRCRTASVQGNDFSYLSGWGIAMYRCTHCRVVHNRCDWCVRGYSDGVYARGQDSAGLLVFEQCSDNVFAGNSATHSGDGLFLYAGHETTQRTGAGGSNRNRVVGNDFSQAVANGIEATFSAGNEFVDNRLDECDHGVWAGYSRATQIRGNVIRRCANGVSIEHGHDNVIAGNRIEDCGRGIHLWWDDDRELLASAYGRAQETASARSTIVGNWITGGGTALRLDGDSGSRIEGNRIAGAGIGLDVRGATACAALAQNDVAAAVAVRCDTAAPFAVGPNAWTPWVVTGSQQVLAAAPLPSPPAIPRPEPAAAHADVPAGDGVFLADDAPRGRQQIVIGEWGPLDPRLPALVPFGPAGVEAATWRIVGAGLPFVVTDLTAGFVAEPATGIGPAVVRVQPSAGRAAASAAEWRATVRIGGQDFAASGLLVATSWRVRWWAWDVDPRTDAAAFAALLTRPPLDVVTVPALDFAWGAGRPTAKVPADRFATVAETTCTVPAGTWRLCTVSDDGIRVLVDGEVEIEDWTWHAPTAKARELSLAAGPHTIRVEHFELDGWAELRCWLEPVRLP